MLFQSTFLHTLKLCFVATACAWPAVNGGAVDPESTVRTEAVAVHEASPANFILHALELKGLIEPERSFVQLRGPSAISPILVGAEATIEAPTGYFLWYEIAKPKPVKSSTLAIDWPPQSSSAGLGTVGNATTQAGTIEVQLSTPRFLLSPAQRIATGPPAELPASIGFMKVFELDAVSAERISKAASGELADRTPRMICLPAAMWHHEEHQPIAENSPIWIVFETNSTSQTDSESASTLDLFGFNQFTIASSNRSMVGTKISTKGGETPRDSR